MSDGPHKSLPMQRHWRRFARRAGNPASSMQEVAEELRSALRREFAAAPIDDVRDILGAGSKQASLFAQERMTQLESLRARSPGLPSANTLIDCALEVALADQVGDAALCTALESALDSRTRDCFRSVEEHYQREDSSRDAAFMGDRLKSARGSCDYKSLASDLSAWGAHPRSSANSQKNSGIDEGPTL